MALLSKRTSDMNQINIALEGYARKTDKNRYIASSTCVLIEAPGCKILTDPGIDPLLPEALKKLGLKPEMINVVFLSHRHADHIENRRLFPCARTINGWSCESGLIRGTDVRIVDTPGHLKKHAALILDCQGKSFAVAGDVFWWEDGQQPKMDRKSLMDLPDPFARDWAALLASRKKLLDTADYIIPGHGRLFKTPLI